MDLAPLDQQLPKEELRQQYEVRKRIVEKTKRLELCIGILESTNKK
ncbi:zinc knuckle family protein [Loa loa]|uniref:Zinc knuckle family protein n=1 Tax=Loa loa TaxID=7209 RepID=A0A1S0TPC4_LOALO|nr:zinc knuckle family protein [Loa loa]EFO17508.1 zinc knuckle family protein [Loa loa]